MQYFFKCVQKDIVWKSRRYFQSTIKNIVIPAGFTKLYPVQKRLLEELSLDPKANLIVKSATGSGKTLAFLIPTIQKIISKPYKPGTEVLIVLPTRFGSNFRKKIN